MNKTRKTQGKSWTEKVYKASDYESNDGMLTTVWGPPMWHYLHTMSFNYPVKPTIQDKTHYKNTITNLQYTLPCGKCRMNLKKNFRSLPLTMAHMKNRHTFSKYVFDLHEKVNTMLNKKSGLTFEMVRERYEHFRSRCAKTKNERKKTGNTKTRRKKEKGCTEPLTGEKSKCVLHIVPRDKSCDTFQMDKQCEKVKILP
jgi:hypothetical protein